jgi:hypothetical protein
MAESLRQTDDWTQILNLLDRILKSKKLLPKREDETDRELHLGLHLNGIARDLSLHVGGPLLDYKGIRRVATNAVKDGTYESYVTSLASWLAYVEAFDRYTRRHRKYYTKDELIDIKKSWGVIDSGALYEKYVLQRLPREYHETYYRSAGNL